MKKYFITGIGTDVGKTVVSAILTEYLKADYWKPVQAGELNATDTMKIQSLITNEKSKFHPERFLLKSAMSPHAAAAKDGVSIDIDDLKLPESDNDILLIEGAGGLMVPLNEWLLVIDLIGHFDAEAIIVSQNYLGSINHTLLTLEVLQRRKIPIKGIIFNGPSNPETEEIIKAFSEVPVLFSVPAFSDISKISLTDFIATLPADLL